MQCEWAYHSRSGSIALAKMLHSIHTIHLSLSLCALPLQDEFALRSHTLADKAFKEGNLSDIIPVKIPGMHKSWTKRISRQEGMGPGARAGGDGGGSGGLGCVEEWTVQWQGYLLSRA